MNTVQNVRAEQFNCFTIEYFSESGQIRLGEGYEAQSQSRRVLHRYRVLSNVSLVQCKYPCTSASLSRHCVYSIVIVQVSSSTINPTGVLREWFRCTSTVPSLRNCYSISSLVQLYHLLRLKYHYGTDSI